MKSCKCEVRVKYFVSALQNGWCVCVCVCDICCHLLTWFVINCCYLYAIPRTTCVVRGGNISSIGYCIFTGEKKCFTELFMVLIVAIKLQERQSNESERLCMGDEKVVGQKWPEPSLSYFSIWRKVCCVLGEVRVHCIYIYISLYIYIYIYIYIPLYICIY